MTGPHGLVMVRGRPERAVLVALVMAAGEVVSVDRLTEAVWGDRAPASHAKVVQNVVLRLRKLLGPDVIETRPSGYVLCVDPDATDLHRFDRFRRAGRACFAAGDRDEAAAMFEVACGLWRGPPLVDLVDHPSANGDAERLMEELRQTREAFAEVALALGRHGEWVPALETMVVEEPLREGRWGLLMLALHGCGRHADALRAFQRARAALIEVGLEPGPDLRALERRLCADHVGVSLSWSGAGVLGNVRPPMTSWIGSSDRLRERAADLTSSRLVTLVGPGGVGKTRLAIEAGLLSATRFPGGVWFIDLAPIAEPAAVLGVVAATDRGTAADGAASMRSSSACPQRPPALLILDNCEHLTVTGCGRGCRRGVQIPSTTVVATSREPLVLAGERVVTVASMSSDDAFELFCRAGHRG